MFYKDNPSLTMEVQNYNTCLPAVITYAANEMGGGEDLDVNIVTLTIAWELDKTNIDVIYEDGVPIDKTSNVVQSYFVTVNENKEFRSFDYYKAMIDRKMPIITGILTGNIGHAVIIVGYNTDGRTLHYMDPLEGRVKQAEYNIFFYDLNFPLKQRKR